MVYKETFCNSPWYELHVYWDGSYGYCCHQTERPYDKKLSEKYNVKNMSLSEWYNSSVMKKERLKFFTNIKNMSCEKCWQQERTSNTSRRYKSNQKSVIFQRENFYDSFYQSPGFEKFEYSFHNNGDFKELPIDLHIDLGNHCNLACKFCRPDASSKIAAQFNKWNILTDKSMLHNNWTSNDTVWNSFIKDILLIPNLKNIHFMGGETLLSSRIEELVDHLIEKNRYNISISFVTNGTIFNKSLIRKLLKFERVGIEISIESITEHNEYIRQGTNNKLVLDNIKNFLNEISNSTTASLTIRPALSLLSIGSYDTLIEFCIKNRLLIKSNTVVDPSFLKINVLPIEIRKKYVKKYHRLLEEYDFDKEMCNRDYNESNVENYMHVAYSEIIKALNELNLNDHPDQKNLLFQAGEYLKKWDSVYNLNLFEFYPEFLEAFKSYEK